jgi:protein-S-isoprenylcysteine O-methyltransferase Ste14
MTLFEYLVAAFALLYSLAALRLIGGISVALAPSRRYWPHLLLTSSLLLEIAAGFWTFWSLRDVHWNFFGFLVALFVVGTLCYLAAVLVPENAAAVVSWRAHYSAVRHRWYAGLALFGVAMAANATVNLGFPLAHPSRVIQAYALGLGIIGAVSSRDRVHEVLAVLFAIGVAGLTFTLGLSPSWLLHL